MAYTSIPQPPESTLITRLFPPRVLSPSIAHLLHPVDPRQARREQQGDATSDAQLAHNPLGRCLLCCIWWN